MCRCAFWWHLYDQCADSIQAPSLNAYNDIAGIFHDSGMSIQSRIAPAEGLLVVDIGYSSSTVTPLYRGKPIQQAVQRLDIGGKFLTNQLKDILSIRQMDIRTETQMANLMKEDVCFVSKSFAADLDSVKKDLSKSSIVLDYVLPDYSTRARGEIRPHNPSAWKQMRMMGCVQTAEGERESLLKLSNERFSVPELLFNPKDIGMNQPGLPELVMRSLSKVPAGLWALMLANIYVVGGTSKLPGLLDRL